MKHTQVHQRPLIISASQTEVGQQVKKIIQIRDTAGLLQERGREELHSKKLAGAKSCCPLLDM